MSRRLRAPGMALRRVLFFGLVAATSLAGAALMLAIVRAGGVSPLEVVILGLFVPTFGWITLAFWNGVLGVLLGVARRDPLSLGPLRRPGVEDAPLRSRTALVMPVHNEDPTATLAGLDATLRSLGETGHADRFHVFLLSDTTDPDVAAREEAAWAALVRRWDADSGRPAGARPASLRYRRRAERAGRKAGNLADFCDRWGGEVDFMVVLDADSVMSGRTLVELARTLEANPRAALLQTVPVPTGQRSRFARLVEAGARVHSGTLAAGQAFWQGDTANYWGHNAIVRVRPFVESARLPVLPGRPPLGGEILSHDFVEAALLRRAGWGVWLLPWLDGSHEDVPATMIDYAVRDRRWCQGSLQHLRLLLRPGLHPLSRLHFVLGAMGYVSSLLWLLMLVAATGWVALEASAVDVLLTRPGAFAAGWPLPSLPPGLSLLAVTAIVLFLPKALATGLAVARERGGPGQRLRLLAGALAEALFSVVAAPVHMMIHARCVLGVLAGRSVPWAAQARAGRRVPWPVALAFTGWMTAAGVAWALLTLAVSPPFFLWLTPIFLGLWIAAPLVRWTSGAAAGTPRRAPAVASPERAAPATDLDAARVSWEAGVG